MLSNALKFTDPKGRVKVAVSLLGQEPFLSKSSCSNIKLSDEEFSLFNATNAIVNKFQIHIEDNGAGISEEGKKKLFQDYSSLAEHLGKNSRGTGLGLCIVNKII